MVGRECRRGAGSVLAPPGRTRVGRWATGSSRVVAVGSRPGERGHPQPQTAGDRPASLHFVTAILPPGKVWGMSRIDPDLLFEFSVITEETAEYRRHSFGARSREKQFDDEGRSYTAWCDATPNCRFNTKSGYVGIPRSHPTKPTTHSQQRHSIPAHGPVDALQPEHGDCDP